MLIPRVVVCPETEATIAGLSRELEVLCSKKPLLEADVVSARALAETHSKKLHELRLVDAEFAGEFDLYSNCRGPLSLCYVSTV